MVVEGLGVKVRVTTTTGVTVAGTTTTTGVDCEVGADQDSQGAFPSDSVAVAASSN